MGEAKMNAIRYTVASAAAMVGLIAGQPQVAHADQWSYVSALDDNGVAYSTVSGVITLGKQVCHEIRGGTSLQAVGGYLLGPMGYTRAEAASIVVAATNEMCPDAIPVLEQQLASNRAPAPSQAV